MQRRRGQPLAQVGFSAIGGEGDAVHRADIDTGVAFDAFGRVEHGLHIAVQAALRFQEGLLDVEAQLDFQLSHPSGVFSIGACGTL